MTCYIVSVVGRRFVLDDRYDFVSLVIECCPIFVLLSLSGSTGYGH